MIEIIRRVKKHPIRRILCRTGAVAAIVGFVISMAILLFVCASPSGEAYCSQMWEIR